jgi:hypothetical protein
MVNGDGFRLDWRQEFKRLSPYLEKQGGVIRIEFQSENAAPLKFNHFLKEAFAQTDTVWRSLRIDHEWFTTRQVHGVIDEIDRLLTEVGFPAKFPIEPTAPINILTDVEVGGNMTTNISGLHVNHGPGHSGRAFRERADAVFEALRHYIEGGGRFMVIVNDMPLADQTEFWRHVWNSGLSAAGGSAMLLVIHAGPKAGRRQHHDSPDANERIILPCAVEEDTDRDYQFFDDLSDAFAKAGIGEPGAPAGVHLENNRGSILLINMKLSAAIMSAKKAQERPKA